MNPDIPDNNIEQIDLVKKAKLEEIRAEVEEIRDGLDEPIDKSIKDTVIYFKALGLNTSQSCEGHVEREGKRSNHIPYIDLRAPNNSKYRFIKEQEICERVASENKIDVKDLRKNRVLYDQAWQELVDLYGGGDWPLIEERVNWVAENEKLYKDLESLLNEFYQDREVPEEIKLILNGNYNTRLRITNNAGVYTKVDAKGFISKDRDAEITGNKDDITEKVSNWQEEMKAFTEFLKNKFLGQ